MRTVHIPQSSVLAGLCGTCVMCRRIVTARGSVFFYCIRADADPAYVKYPRLPVLRCPGYLPMPAPPSAEGGRGEGGEGAREGERP